MAAAYGEIFKMPIPIAFSATACEGKRMKWITRRLLLEKQREEMRRVVKTLEREIERTTTRIEECREALREAT
mgnify:CR=1 FL=1